MFSEDLLLGLRRFNALAHAAGRRLDGDSFEQSH